jgi:hypothetical protein
LLVCFGYNVNKLHGQAGEADGLPQNRRLSADTLKKQPLLHFFYSPLRYFRFYPLRYARRCDSPPENKTAIS